MAHKFNAKDKHKLDNPKRREMLPPLEVLDRLGLKEGDSFADIGCGIGYFSIPAADIVGSNGIVYVVDIEQEMLSEIEGRAGNIKTILSDEYDLKIDDNSINYAFMCTVLHEVDDKYRFINEVERILKDDGTLAVIEWIKRESDWGPPVDHRVDVSVAAQVLHDCGFKDVRGMELNEYFYVINAKRRKLI